MFTSEASQNVTRSEPFETTRDRRSNRPMDAGVAVGRVAGGTRKEGPRGGADTEGTRGAGVEREGVEIRLGLLQVCLGATRSSSVAATKGPTDSSASVTAVMRGSRRQKVRGPRAGAVG